MTSRFKGPLILLLWAGLFALCALHQALAQGSATVDGTVVDAAGAAIPASHLTLTSVDTNLARAAVSTSDGYFVFHDLHKRQNFLYIKW